MMSEEMVCRKHRLSSFQIIILGFAGVILLGALLLMLPLSTTARCVTPFHEALFTATSAVCVTGLVVQDTGSYWSVFGKAVILTLIQIGGLGVVTVAASFALLSGRRISLMQRSTMQDAISAPKVGGIVRLTRFILRGTFLIELIGALAMLPVFCRDYGWHGIWMAVFHSISAFCNAGFDILGTNNNLYPSLTGYVQNPVINITVMLLIITGGIGFLTWDDIFLPQSDADNDWWNMVYHWDDCPVLAGLDLGDYTSDAVQNDSGSSQELLSHYYIGIRGAWTKDAADLLSGGEALWQALTAGAVSTVTKEG